MINNDLELSLNLPHKNQWKKELMKTYGMCLFGGVIALFCGNMVELTVLNIAFVFGYSITGMAITMLITSIIVGIGRIFGERKFKDSFFSKMFWVATAISGLSSLGNLVEYLGY